MKNSRRFAPLPLAAALLTTGATVTYVPISCGCVDPWSGIAYSIGQPDMKDPSKLTAKAIADGFARKLSGKKVGVHSLPVSTSTYDCAIASSPQRTVRCRWWLWEIPNTYDVNYKGFDVIVTTGTDQTFRKIEVIPIRHGTQK